MNYNNIETTSPDYMYTFTLETQKQTIMLTNTFPREQQNQTGVTKTRNP